MKRLVAVALVLVAAALAPASHAAAGSYDVVSCGDPDTHRMTGQSGYPPGWHWSESAPGGGSWAIFASCSSWGAGFGFQTNPIGGNMPYPHSSEMGFSPPADTSVSGVRIARALRRPNAAAGVVPMLATTPVDWCHTYWSSCTVGDYDHPDAAVNLADMGGAAWLRLYCDGSAGCPRDGRGAWKVLGARIALADGYSPTFRSPPAGPLAAAGSIIGGPTSVSVDGADRGGGLLRAEVLAGTRVVGAASFDSNGRCDTSFHTDLVPCPLSGSRTIGVDFAGVDDGTYAMTVRLTDIAGNQTSYALGTKTLDRGVPGTAQPARPPARWLDAVAARDYREAIAMAPGALVPSSGIAGYAVTTDGSDPGTAANAPAGADGTASFGPPAGGWSEGTVIVKARAISGAGRAGPIGQATLHVDRSPPALSILGAGNGHDPQPGPVTATLIATDQLSGMGAADDGAPVESGGYVAYTLDGGLLTKSAGGEARVRIEGAGTHTVTFRAYDAAGNVSADRTAVVVVADPGESAAGGGPGFSDRALNPGTTFSAAESFGQGCPARVTLTPSRDAYVDQSLPDAGFGTASSLLVRAAAGANARSLLDFDLPPAGGCRAASAQLRLYASSGASGRTLAAYRLGSSWDANEVTWATRPGVTGAAATTASGGDGGWIAFDVTEQVRGQYRDGDTGLLVRDVSEGAAAPMAQVLAASEGVPAQRPQLIVSFE